MTKLMMTIYTPDSGQMMRRKAGARDGDICQFATYRKIRITMSFEASNQVRSDVGRGDALSMSDPAPEFAF